MVKVSVEISDGVACFTAAVWANNIEGAMSLVSSRYPGRKAKVVFPIDGEMFFGRGPLPTSGEFLMESAEKIAV